MKISLTGFCRSLDFFGAPLFQQIDRDQSLYTSLVGGFASILIFSTSLVYSTIIIYQWSTNQLSPKVQHSDYVSNFEQLDLNYDVLKITFWKLTPDSIDPFEQNILIAMMNYSTNYESSYSEILTLSNQTTYEGNYYLIPKMRLAFTDIDGSTMTSSEMFIYFVKCQQSLLPDGQQCASEELVQKFYSQPSNTIVLQINYRNFDSHEKKVKSSVQEFIINFENKTCYTMNTYLQSTLFEINDAILFEKSNTYEYINGALIQTQTNSVDYCTSAFNYETYLLIYVIMSGSQSKALYEYPHLSDILANIGSIISSLFLLKYLILSFNNYFLQDMILHQLLTLYYPQFSKIKIKRDWRCNKNQVYYCGKRLIQQEEEQFFSLYKKVILKVKLKLSIVNIVYEMSRLYFLFRSFKSIEEIKKVHQIGISLDFTKQNVQNIFSDGTQRMSCRSQDLTPRVQSLGFDDLGILSLDERQNIDFKSTDELDLVDDFYEINRIL